MSNPSPTAMTPEALKALEDVAQAIYEYQARYGAAKNPDYFNGVEKALGFVHAAIKRGALAAPQEVPHYDTCTICGVVKPCYAHPEDSKMVMR